MTIRIRPGSAPPVFLGWFIAWVAVLSAAAPPCGAQSIHDNPLRPPDTSSPRAAFLSFTENLGDAFRDFQSALVSYKVSGRLYFSREEEELFAKNRRAAEAAIECIDLSDVSQNVRNLYKHELAVYLAEILARIPLPDPESIPDRASMDERGITRWRIPGTRIEIALIADGPREGEYLFSRETAASLEEYFARVEHLPYRDGYVWDMYELYGSFGLEGDTFYHQYIDSPFNLRTIVPFRWMAGLPDWAQYRIFGVVLWKWFALAAPAAAGVGLVWFAHRLARRRGGIPSVAPVLSIVAVSWVLLQIETDYLRIGGDSLVAVSSLLTLALYLGGAWAALRFGALFGEWMVTSRRFPEESMDAQLVRLMAQLGSVAVAAALMIEGADELGLPAYSVFAGLGIGGLAVALAAQESLSNLLASIFIMLEKPFRVQQWVKVGEVEGIVTKVGFRSTQVRTFYNSLVTIPNNVLVKTPIDNLGARTKRRQKFAALIAYKTPPETIEAFTAGIRDIVTNHPNTDKETQFIHFNNLGENGLEILVYYHLYVFDYEAELREREKILLEIVRLAKRLDVEFAFPTRTLQVESLPPGAQPPPQGNPGPGGD